MRFLAESALTAPCLDRYGARSGSLKGNSPRTHGVFTANALPAGFCDCCLLAPVEWREDTVMEERFRDVYVAAGVFRSTPVRSWTKPAVRKICTDAGTIVAIDIALRHLEPVAPVALTLAFPRSLCRGTG
jgi:hypothetical protein